MDDRTNGMNYLMRPGTVLEGLMMTRWSGKFAVLAAFGVVAGAALVMNLSGCALSYNGAWATPEDAAEEDYEAFQKRMAVERRAAQDRQAQLHPAAYETPSDPQRDLKPVGSTGQTMPVSTQPDANFALFGARPTIRQVHSPADSTTTARQITFATEGADVDPAIDPSGRWLAFSSTRHRPTYDIYLQSVDGTSVTQLTADPSSDRMPVFSPDGKQIAFCSDRSGNWDIYLMDLDGSNQTVRLTDDPADEVHPTFSPDGTRLAYATATGGEGEWELVIVELDNSRAAKRFIGQHGLFPQWSPDGRKLLFQRARERGSAFFSMWTVDIVGDEARMATEITSSPNAGIINPAWSPDGSHLVFCTVVNPPADDRTRPATADIWIVGADGKHRSNLTASRFLNYQPAWSSDGWIYFVSNRGPSGTETIWALRPDAAITVASGGRMFDGVATMQPGDEPTGNVGSDAGDAGDAGRNRVAAEVVAEVGDTDNVDP